MSNDLGRSAADSLRVQGDYPHGFRQHQQGDLHVHQGCQNGYRDTEWSCQTTEVFTLSKPTTEVSFPLPEGTLSITTLEIVPPGEYQREMTVTSVDEETLAVGDQPGVLKSVTILPVEPPITGDFSLPDRMFAVAAVLGIMLLGLGARVVARRP